MAQVAFCSQTNTKHIHIVWAERTVVQISNLLVYPVTSRLWKVKKIDHRNNTGTECCVCLCKMVNMCLTWEPPWQLNFTDTTVHISTVLNVQGTDTDCLITSGTHTHNAQQADCCCQGHRQQWSFAPVGIAVWSKLIYRVSELKVYKNTCLCFSL
jgi:hypothetical protein